MKSKADNAEGHKWNGEIQFSQESEGIMCDHLKGFNEKKDVMDVPSLTNTGSKVSVTLVPYNERWVSGADEDNDTPDPIAYIRRFFIFADISFPPLVF